MKTLPVLFITVCLALVFATCGKGKFETKPRLEFESYNKIVDSPGILKFAINYFDKEGDLNEGFFVAKKERLNRFPPPPATFVDSFGYQLPKFPEKDNAEIEFKLAYNFLDEALGKNDTIRFKFVVTDRAGNQSDTLYSDPIIVRQP